MPPQTRSRKQSASVAEPVDELRDIREALLGNFDDPGLIHKFNTFAEHVEKELKDLRTQFDKSQELQNKEIEKIRPVIEFLGNWKFLVGFLVGLSSFIYTIIKAAYYIKGQV